MDDFNTARSLFPILEGTNYLNSCSLGALSTRAEERLADFTGLWHKMGASAWYEHWLGRLDELRTQVGDLFGASSGSIALLPSTSACLAVIAESLSTTTRNRIITTDLDFPTLLYLWKVRPDVELVVLESRDGLTVGLDQFADAIDDRTLVVATSHVFFTTGHVQDLKALSALAHGSGALCLIDGYQGAGQIPVHLPDSDVDFYTAGPLKWLCGGPGLAYLYVRAELIRTLEPRITSWFATKDQFHFNPGEFRYHDDARRFELGTPALPTVHTALGGQEIVMDLGMDRIRNRNRQLTDRLIDRCQEAGFPLRISPNPEDRSAIVLIGHDHPARAVAELATRGIIVDHRPGVVRVSPHFYNTEGEVDDCVAALIEVDEVIRG